MKITYSVNDLGLNLDKNDLYGIRISLCNLKPGVFVNKGNPLLFVENNGMIHKFFSPISGTVANVFVKQLGFVNVDDSNQPLITIDTVNLLKDLDGTSNISVPSKNEIRNDFDYQGLRLPSYSSAIDGYYGEFDGDSFDGIYDNGNRYAVLPTNNQSQHDSIDQDVYNNDERRFDERRFIDNHVCQRCLQYCKDGCQDCIRNDVDCYLPEFADTQDFHAPTTQEINEIGYENPNMNLNVYNPVRGNNPRFLPVPVSSGSVPVSSGINKDVADNHNLRASGLYNSAKNNDQIPNYDHWKNAHKFHGKKSKFSNRKKKLKEDIDSLKSEINSLNKKVIENKKNLSILKMKEDIENFVSSEKKVVSTQYARNLAKKLNIDLSELARQLGTRVITKDDVVRYAENLNTDQVE